MPESNRIALPELTASLFLPWLCYDEFFPDDTLNGSYKEAGSGKKKNGKSEIPPT